MSLDLGAFVHLRFRQQNLAICEKPYHTVAPLGKDPPALRVYLDPSHF